MSIKSLHTLFFNLLVSCALTSTVLGQEVLVDSTAQNNNFLTSKVQYFAKDSSIILLADKKILLYHEAQVNYEDIELKAAYIEIDSEKNTVFAKSLKDSAGVSYGYPLFSENNNSFTSKEITYNFKTKKGIIKEVVTLVENKSKELKSI